MSKKRRSADDESGSNVGLVMTVSLFLIILTFFILLNSIAVIDERKTRVALGSLLGAFGTLPGGLSPMRTGESIIPPSAPMVEEDLDVTQLMSIMNAKIAGEIGVETVKSGQKITISVSENALFLKGGSILNPAVVPFLKELCARIKGADYLLEIVGHTDDTPAQEKGYDSNWEVSILTAIQVLKYFVTDGNIRADRITAYGCGSNKPVISNDTRKSRNFNRRVEIILGYKGPEFMKKIYKKKPFKFFTYKKFDFKIF